jgi:hypothetical protein
MGGLPMRPGDNPSLGLPRRCSQRRMEPCRDQYSGRNAHNEDDHGDNRPQRRECFFVLSHGGQPSTRTQRRHGLRSCVWHGRLWDATPWDKMPECPYSYLIHVTLTRSNNDENRAKTGLPDSCLIDALPFLIIPNLMAPTPFLNPRP